MSQGRCVRSSCFAVPCEDPLHREKSFPAMEGQTTGTIRQEGFNNGYLQAMDLMMAHWPEDRKCKCDPVLSGQQGPKATSMVGHCYQYCWVQTVYQTAATNAGEERT